ncbi:MAG: Nif3-like dinuclear metal center hexameric protein [Lachnospiraceae bacterium]|nr:Nif3-like dinuclear metal center hexameric protein [Lachnospiraceae bacterium]
MTCREIIDILQKQSPEHYACAWDNVGLLVGNYEKEVQTIYIALDATEEAIAEAVEEGADMLLTHHPMIFRELKKVNSDDFIGRRVISLIQNDISYYAMHTNFDVKGMAELGAEKMELTKCQVLDVTCREEQGEEGIGKVGMLPCEMTVTECARRVKEVFGVELVKIFGIPDKKVTKAAICPGSGKSVIGKAIEAGAQVLITGDIDHHDGIDGAAQGLALIDAGHYGVEKIFIPYMKQYLEEHTSGIKVTAQPPRQPFLYQ